MIAANIVHFARVLRGAGMAIGPDRVLAALAAVELVGMDRRDDVRAALSAVMLERHEQQALFDAAFDTFWRDPKLLEQMLYLLLPKITGRGEPAADFLIDDPAEHGLPGLVQLFGIESPGLTSSLSIAEDVMERLG